MKMEKGRTKGRVRVEREDKRRGRKRDIRNVVGEIALNSEEKKAMMKKEDIRVQGRITGRRRGSG